MTAILCELRVMNCLIYHLVSREVGDPRATSQGHSLFELQATLKIGTQLVRAGEKRFG